MKQFLIGFLNAKNIWFNLNGYSNIRIYAFLAMISSLWFNKYAKCLEWPVIFRDLREVNLK